MLLKTPILFFGMNSYFASVAQQEEPDLIGRPVGVLTTKAANAACIAASNEAKRRGVKMGTRMGEARSLCPDIVFRVVKHDACVRYHHAIRAAAKEIIPIHAAQSVDEFSCHLMGREQVLETALGIAAELQVNILRRVGPAMCCSVGVAPTRLLVKIATELQKPMGMNWLHPAVLPGKIAYLDLPDLPGVSGGILPRLQRAGLRSAYRYWADMRIIAPKSVQVMLHSLVTAENMIPDLFDTAPQPPQQAGLYHMIDALNQKYGKDTIQIGELPRQ